MIYTEQHFSETSVSVSSRKKLKATLFKIFLLIGRQLRSSFPLKFWLLNFFEWSFNIFSDIHFESTNLNFFNMLWSAPNKNAIFGSKPSKHIHFGLAKCLWFFHVFVTHVPNSKSIFLMLFLSCIDLSRVLNISLQNNSKTESMPF